MAYGSAKSITVLYLSILVLVLTVGVTEGQECLDPRLPRPVRGMADGYKINAFGEFDVYEVSPTYDDSVVIQKGNQNSWAKISPKKSWEIKSNILGLTPTRSPSSHAAELEPHKDVHFIDGNPGTEGFAGRPVGDPEITKAWVRVDLPRPQKISAVAMIGMPANFEIRVFDWDIWQRPGGATAAADQKRWRTVYKMSGSKAQAIPQPDNTAPAVYEPEDRQASGGANYKVFRFDPVMAREVWLTSPDDFTLGEFEVLNEKGENVGSFTQGAGATASTRPYLFWLSEQTQSALWQLQYDVGFKWLRLSYYLTPFIWTFVEKEKGVYTIDPYLDQLVTQATENGIEVTLTLGPPENNLYKHDEQAEAFCKYARFMVKHFKGRIKYYEIFNEYYNQDSFGPGNQGPADQAASTYVSQALPAAKAIRKADPKAKICLCGPCPLVADFILAALKKGMADYVDVVTWHPYSFQKDTDNDYAPEELDRPRSVWAPPEVKSYADSVTYLRREAAKLGFEGELWANESGAYAIHASRTSQLIAAKYLARSAVLHTTLDVPMFWNETTSLMRPPWQPFWGNQGTKLKPAYSYYVMRSLCTLLDSAKQEKVTFRLDQEPEKLEKHSFTLPGKKRLLAVWIAEKSRAKKLDDYEGIVADMTIKARKPKKIVGIDLLNGREQELSFEAKRSGPVVKDLIVKDYPLLLRLEY